MWIYCCAVLCMSRQDHYDRVKRAGFLSLKRIMSRSFAIWLSDLQRALQPEPWSKPFNQSRQTALWPIAKGYVPYGAGPGSRVTAALPEGKPRDTVTSLQQCSTSAALVFPAWLQTDSSSHLSFHFLWTHGFRWGINGPGSPAQQMSVEYWLNMEPFTCPRFIRVDYQF